MISGDSPIGPSTGWLSLKLGPAISVHREVLTASGASASEMVLHGEDRLHAMLGESSDLPALRYRALHLGNFGDFRTAISPTQDYFLRDIGRITEQHRLQGTSLHPDTTPLHVYQLLRDHKVPLGIENMDRNKASGRDGQGNRASDFPDEPRRAFSIFNTASKSCRKISLSLSKISPGVLLQ